VKNVKKSFFNTVRNKLNSHKIGIFSICVATRGGGGGGLMLYSPLDTALLLVLLQPSDDGYFRLCSSKSSFRGTGLNS
jgi:hypothetical protein